MGDNGDFNFFPNRIAGTPDSPSDSLRSCTAGLSKAIRYLFKLYLYVIIYNMRMANLSIILAKKIELCNIF
ncbi:hypothetical protein J2Z66_003087 [Paenibacillus eucommiae]|uniref:Uncharacterized protein n=1 Tax=Paenibacillus eucommiae TaxID=1355755 RepID=A0ABS4IWM4_9BACL|nr:hypothetical protein [Paenibacillus eucommiae]